jgi:hypothetical protein
MLHAIQRYDPLLMVNPQKHAPCANPILVQIFEIFRHVLEGKPDSAGIGRKPFDFLDNPQSLGPV